MSYDLGDVVVLAATARDSAGDPANAAGVALTVTLPDGETASPEVTNPPASTGEYSVEFPTTQAGLHQVRWVFTTPGSAHTDVFNVRPATSRQIVSLADAKQALRKTTSVNDEELRNVIVATTTKIEDVIGPVVRGTYVDHVRGGGNAIALTKRPVLDVTTVEPLTGSTAVDVTGLEVDSDSGVVWRRDGGSLPAGELRVTYVSGRPIIDEAILEAAYIIIDHLWQNRRGHATRPGLMGQQKVEQPTNEEQSIAYYAGFALPHRAAELLEPFELQGGFA